MSDIGKPERETQRRIIKLFQNVLGYSYLGDWSVRNGNSNIEESLLTKYLEGRGYSDAQISVALHRLQVEATNSSRSLYGNNQTVYGLMRYGVDVKIEASKPTDTVHLIDWAQPENNHFALAEEVTLKVGQERRPDIVLYVNGIAVGFWRLKTAVYRLAMESGKTCPTRSPNLTNGSSVQSNSFSQGMTPKGSCTAPSEPRKNSS